MKALVLSTLLVLVASAAQAVPHVITAISQSWPPYVITDFIVEMVGPGEWCSIKVVDKSWWDPSTADTTHIFGGDCPPGWIAEDADGHGVVFRRVGDPAPCFGPGDIINGLNLITNGPSPCVHFIFETSVVGTGSYHIDGCLGIDLPTQPRPTSWGMVKSRYW